MKVTRSNLDLYLTSISDIIKYMNGILQNSVALINCAGLTNKRMVDEMEIYKINSILPHVLSRLCSTLKVKFFHITTDCVFNGLHGPYDEKSKHEAWTKYGLSKSIGEPLHPINDDYCVLKAHRMYG